MYVTNEIQIAYVPVKRDSFGERLPTTKEDYIFDNYEEAFDCLCNIISSTDKELTYINVDRTIFFIKEHKVI